MKTALDPGVYARGGDGKQRLVHLYQGGDCRLADIVEFFQLGKLEEAGGADEAVLVLTGKELQTLKTMADAFSFDYEEEFIDMCLEMTGFAAGLAAAPDSLEIRFTEYF